MTDQDKVSLLSLATSVFTPRQPITRSDQLAGRKQQIGRIVGATSQLGAHVIIYGERGVGKTSLANCVSPLLHNSTIGASETVRVIPPINCDTSDSYSSIWKKVFTHIEVAEITEGLGYRSDEIENTTVLADSFETISPFDVERTLDKYCGSCSLVLIIDEFDRVQNPETTRLMADTIKALSDQKIQATLILVGVGDSVTHLIRGHESVGRNLVEVHLPRMSLPEQEKIITSRLPDMDLTIAEAALRIIVSLSRGFPYYVHLLGQKAAIAAISRDMHEITCDHIAESITSAIHESEMALKQTYYRATQNTQPNNQYPATLAACALTACDEFGYFAPKDIIEPLSWITGTRRETSTFIERLNQLSDDRRGRILTVDGDKRCRRYRFTDPMMQPFIALKSIADKLISFDSIVTSTVTP